MRVGELLQGWGGVQGLEKANRYGGNGFKQSADNCRQRYLNTWGICPNRESFEVKKIKSEVFGTIPWILFDIIWIETCKGSKFMHVC